MQEKVILAVELDSNKKMQIRINTTNEALLSLALLKAQYKCLEFIEGIGIENDIIDHNYLMSIEFNDKKEIEVIISTKNQALVALSLRKAIQCVDIYLDELEIKKEQKAVNDSLTVVPASVLEKLGG